MPDNLTSLPVWLRYPLEQSRKFIAPLILLLSAVTYINQLIQLWRGDWATFTWIISVLSSIGLIVTLVYISFSKLPSTIHTLDNSQHFVRRYPKGYRIARISLVVVFLVTISAGYLLYRAERELRDKVVVVVANFQGPDKDNYQIYDDLVSRLKRSSAGYKDTIIVPLRDITIREDDGSTYARELGKAHRADLVIWGRYGVINKEERIIINIEVLSDEDINSLFPTPFYDSTSVIDEINHFQVSERISKKMTAMTLFLAGLIRYKAGDEDEVVRLCSAALEQGEWPEELIGKAQLFLLRGQVLAYKGQLRDALNDFKKAIELDAINYKAWNNQGYVYLALNQTQSAIDAISKSININPRYDKAYLNLSAVYTRLKAYDQAIENCLQAIKINPVFPAAYNNLANAYYQKKQFQDAIHNFSKAIELNPRMPQPYVGRAECKWELGERYGATEDLSRAIKIAPQFPSAYVLRGFYFSQLGDSQAAISDYSAAIIIDPNNAEALAKRGVEFGILGKRQDAFRDFTQLVNVYPKRVKPYLLRSIALYERQKYDDALIDLDKAISNIAYDQAEQYDIGQAYFLRGVIKTSRCVYADALDDFIKSKENNFDEKMLQEALDKLYRTLGGQNHQYSLDELRGLASDSSMSRCNQ
jgi:tetratricopeptide (TPR) repeat protein